jgi:mRNA-degrading endonuclease toxin of MazEF toxin-antitoxin module
MTMQAHDLICNGCSRLSARPTQCHLPNHHTVPLATMFDTPSGDSLPPQVVRKDHTRNPLGRLPTVCPVCQQTRYIENNKSYSATRRCMTCYRDEVKMLDTRRIGARRIGRSV